MTLTGEWKKSRRSGPQGGNCVEVRRTEDCNVQVRDSKHPNDPALTFTADQWNTFIGSAKDGEFNLDG